MEVDSETVNGAVLHKLKQTHNGIPIYNTHLVLETNNADFTAHAYGAVIEDLDDDIPNATPSITREKAFELAIKRFRKDRPDIAAFDASSVKYDVEEVYYYDDEGKKYHRVYNLVFMIETEDVVARQRYFIDVFSGDVIAHYNEIRK